MKKLIALFVLAMLASPAWAGSGTITLKDASGNTQTFELQSGQSGATGGQMKASITCDNHVFKHITTATDTLAVTGVASQTVYICGWRSRAAGVATWFLEDSTSTGTCTSLTQLTGVATEAANTGETILSATWSGLKGSATGHGLCINSTGTGGVDVDIWYTVF
jgi:hypothetical protein